MKEPIAKKIPKLLNYHGESSIDDYYWLREKESQEVLDYLHQENNYTEHQLEHTKSFQDMLFQEIKDRIQEDDQSVPVLEQGYFYYHRSEVGKQYDIHCRKKHCVDAKEEILIDENILAQGKAYFSLSEYAISANNKYLAYAIDEEGDELYSIYIKDLDTQLQLCEPIQGAYYGLEWDNENKYIYYTTVDDTHRPYRLMRFDWKQNKHQCVFEELDPSFFLEISKSKDDTYLILTLNSQITSEVYLKSLKDDSTFFCVQPRQEGVEYDIDFHKGFLYKLTNEQGATNFKLMTCHIDKLHTKQWKEVLPYNASHYLQELEAFKDYFVLHLRIDGLPMLQVFDANFENPYYISFPEESYAVSLGDNPSYDTHLIRLHYRSLVTPNTTFDYDCKNHKLIERKVQQIPSGYIKNEYETKRIYATSHDGEKIPLSIVYKKDQLKPEGNPLYLYGYGSYGVNVDPFFSVANLSLLNRGFIFAIATIRGGSEKGRTWYQEGKFLQKKNTFLDFIACATYLIKEQYTTQNLLFANGGSAGGLLMGAVANIAPELFCGIISDVPFVDVVNTMMDETIPLTVIEYDEWGNPNEKQFFDYMKSYSPYDNIERKDYPNILVTAGLNDPRVQYWEPAKYIAKLRSLRTNQQRLLLKTNMDAGHGGASGRFDRIKETAFEFAFIFDCLQAINHE